MVYSVVWWVERGVQRPCAGGFEAAKELRRRVFIPQPGQVEFHKKGWPDLRLRGGRGDSKVNSHSTVRKVKNLAQMKNCFQWASNDKNPDIHGDKSSVPNDYHISS